MKKATCLPMILLVVLLVACGASTPPSSSSQPQFWDGLYDMAGNHFDFEQQETILNNFEVNYALGWALDNPEYQTIKTDDMVAGYKVSLARSSYSVQHFEGKPPSTMAERNEYCLNTRDKPLSGIVIFGADLLCFFPYPKEDGENFLLLSEADDISKQKFTERSTLTLEDGQTIAIQPVRATLFDNEELTLTQKLCAAVSGEPDCDPAFRKTLTKPVVLDVELLTMSLGFRTDSQGMGGGMWGTIADLEFFDRQIANYVTINSVLGTTEADMTWRS